MALAALGVYAGVASATLFGFPASGGVDVRSQASATPRSVRDGVYTKQQAERGAEEYHFSCERCHYADLGGSPLDEAPSLIRDAFLARWGGKTAGDLFATISGMMPADDPGSLNRRAYVDIVAYILEVNSFPAGDRELPRDPQLLRQIVIEALAPGSGARQDSAKLPGTHRGGA